MSGDNLWDDNNDCDLNFLVNETLNNSEFKGMNPFQAPSDPIEVTPPASPGLFYFIQSVDIHFLIRCFPVQNLEAQEAQKKQEILSAYPDLSANSIFFFPVEYIELTQVLMEHVSGRRFSQPGGSVLGTLTEEIGWWMEQEVNEVKVFFRRPRQSTQAFWLGPLGDSKVAQHRLSRAIVKLEQVIPGAQTICQDHLFSVRVAELGHPHFEALRKIFEDGSDANELGQALEDRSLAFYFRELATIRRFWTKIQDYLGRQN